MMTGFRNTTGLVPGLACIHECDGVGIGQGDLMAPVAAPGQNVNQSCHFTSGGDVLWVIGEELLPRVQYLHGESIAPVSGFMAWRANEPTG